MTETTETSRTLSVRLQPDELRALELAASAQGKSVSEVVRDAITARMNPRPWAPQVSAAVGTVVGSLTVQLSSNVLMSGWTTSPFRDDGKAANR